MAGNGNALPLVLIHKRNKQRYPLRGEDFVIGRSKGNLVFDHDPKLSGKHCLIRHTDQGPAIYDLKSRTGIHINGVLLPAGKACLLRPGTEVMVGDQLFVVAEEARRIDKLGRRARKLRAARTRTLLLSLVAVACVLGAALSLFTGGKGGKAGAKGPATLSSIDAEMREALSRMDAFADATRQHRLNEQQTLQSLEQELIPRFTSVFTQLQSYKPLRGDDAAAIDLQRRMAGTYLGQVSAMAKYVRTRDVRYTSELGEYNRQLQVLNDQMNERRAPNGTR